MPKCTIHIDFFHDDCNGCKEEYKEMKGISEVSGLSATEPNNNYDSTQAYKGRTYKEFTEERAKKLYGELLIQYLKNSPNEVEAAKKARRIIRKQCRVRGIPSWAWAQ